MNFGFPAPPSRVLAMGLRNSFRTFDGAKIVRISRCSKGFYKRNPTISRSEIVGK